jgi:hypothetical protein
MTEKDTIEYIYEPLSQFKNVFKDKHRDNIEEYFNKLVEKSQVDINANKETVKQIRKLELNINNLRKRISKFGFLLVMLIFLIVASITAIIIVINNFVQGYVDLTNIIIGVAAVILIGLLLYLIIKKVNPKIKELKSSKDLLQQKLDDNINSAWKQMNPLNELFKGGMSVELFQKTVPLIEFDEMFNRKRLDYFIKRYGLDVDNDINASTLFVTSGEISGNPFFITQDLVHELGTETYTGSITISWTTTSTVNGKNVRMTHHQTLTASVNKPCPYYYENKYLVYGNDAAPDLSFKREETDTEDLNEKQIERKVNKTIKVLNRKAEKSMTVGNNYTVLGNSEFEVLFGATNRDHEVQFRLLFTPLAQKELLAIMKEKQYGFGDEFNFQKEKKINYIYPKHLQGFNINIKPDYYYSYDLDVIRKKFNEYNTDYFRHIYFAFAPLLAIPLYQQQKPQEYIYKDLYDSYVSFYEHEKVVNQMNANEFIHPLSRTKNILKTKILESTNNCDIIKVTSYGYTTREKVDYISRFGGDGRSHIIPVRWIEYIPVSKDTDVAINYIEEEKKETYADKARKFFDDLKNKEIKDDDIFKVGSFIAYIMNKKIK